MADTKVYTIPLRKEFQKASYKRKSNKAVKALKQYVVKHTKCDNVLVGEELNEHFRAQDKDKQLEIINDALDRFIRPILVKDGGNIILIDYENEPEIEIRLAYQGACVGCSIASTGTYSMIADTMQKIIDSRVRIYIL